MMRFAFLFILVSMPILQSCRQHNTHPVAFYYWKSNAGIGDTEKHFFERTGADKLYVRLFDVDIQGNIPQPQAAIHAFDPESLAADYIPVVFITNRTMAHTSGSGVATLAEHVHELILKIMADQRMGVPAEIQIDCDWTATTRERFFSFLGELRNISGRKISCTLRMHQVKYRDRTGIPPADKVYLMAYATSDPIKDDGKNSILDIPLLKDYLKNIGDYPLDTDVALPLYSWAIATNHLGKSKLINGVTEEELPSAVYQKTGERRYEILEDTFLRGIYLNKGFHLRIESVSPELLSETRTFLETKINKPFGYVYYHLDSLFISRFSPDMLK
ncbi:hypothetical protein SAMN02927921_00677 [Sinomicrobium oceani]|uniref:Lipoprotein n=1 Tax=Sinomicrobium oceani TaxID=1150368 RepID=A0A1K1MNF7_9FLAO|nr:hypothetical protein [Sinomicrobium oceani]SFW24700.1 hypothetical protein SAMN02927921_00677 [Sinomicrobium oceani]